METLTIENDNDDLTYDSESEQTNHVNDVVPHDETVNVGDVEESLYTSRVECDQRSELCGTIDVNDIMLCREYPCDVLSRFCKAPADIINIMGYWHDIHNIYRVKHLDIPKHYVVRPEYVNPCNVNEYDFVGSIWDHKDLDNITHFFEQIKATFYVNANFVISQCINIFLKHRSATETYSLETDNYHNHTKYKEWLYPHYFKPLIRCLSLFKRVYAVQLDRMFTSLRYTTTDAFDGYFPPFLYLSATMGIFTLLQKLGGVCNISIISLQPQNSTNGIVQQFSITLQIYNHKIQRYQTYTLSNNTTEDLILMLASKTNAVICGIAPHFINRNNNSCCWPARM